jgi:hypothetical protein
MRRWMRGFGLVGALTLSLVACSSSDDDGSGTTTTATTTPTTATTTPTRAPTTVAAETTAPATTATATSAPPASSSPTTAGAGSTTPGFNATPAFCAAATEFDERRDIVQSSFSGDSTPTLARQAWDELDGVIAGLVASSPELIAPDVDTTRRAFAVLRGVFEEYGYDTQRLFDAAQADPALGAALRLTEDPDFSAASERIDAFVARACATP